MAELGVAYLSIIPETSKIAPGIRKAIRDAKATVSAEVDGKSASAASGKLDAVAHDRTAEVKVDVDTASLSRANKLLGKTNSLSGQTALTFGQMAVGATALGSALIPVAAAAGGLAAALAAPLAAAGGGLTLYGIIAGTAVSRTNEQIKEIDRLKEAVKTADGAIAKADAMKAYKAALNELSPAQTRFMNAQNALGQSFDRLTKKVGPAIFGPLVKGMNLLGDVLPKLSPIIRAVSGALSGMLDGLGKATKGPAFKGFINFFATQAPPAIRSFGRIAGDVASGVGGLVKAFAPLGKSVLASVERLSAGFADFGRTADSNSGVRGFIDYVRQTMPLVGQTFRSVGGAVGQLIMALAPIGTVVLRAIGQFANLIRNIPVPVLTAAIGGLVGVLVTYKAIMLGAAFATRVAKIATVAHTIATKAMTAGQWALNVAMRANPIGLVITALVALGAGLVLAYKKSSTFRKIVNGAWGAIKKGATVAWAVIKRVFNAMKPAFTAVGNAAKWLWDKAIEPAFTAIKKGISVAWGVAKRVFSIWKSVMTGDLGGAFTKLKSLASDAWDAIVRGVKAIPGIIVRASGAFLNAGKKLMGALWDGLKNIGGGALGLAKSIANGVIGFINSAIDHVNDGLEMEIPGLPDINPPNIPHVPAFARGGRVQGATLAMIGEGKEAESILPDSVLRGLLKKAHGNGADDSLRSVLVRLTRVLRDVAAALKPSGTSSPDLPSPGGGSGPSGKQFLQGFDAGKGGKGLDGFTKSMKRSTPQIQHMDKALKQAGARTVGLQMAVGKSSKKIGKYWTDIRQKSIRPFAKDWHRTFSKDAVLDANMLDRGVDKNTRQIDNNLQRFRRGPLQGFAKDWGQKFRRDTPGDVDVFREKTLTQFGRTHDGIKNTWGDRIKPVLKDFGSYPKQQVAPAFAKGTDAIGTAWEKVEGKSKSPIKFVIETVLNKGLIASFNKIAKFVDMDGIKELSLPKGFRGGGHTGNKPRNAVAGVVHGDEYVVRSESQREIEKRQPGFLDRLNKYGAKALPGHRKGGFVDPDKRVYLGNEPLSAIHAAQLALASRMSRTAISVMQGSWQPATSYSGTSHTGPGVADTGPGSFDQQKWQRKVGIAAWARNIPGAAYAGSGAHIHGVSLLSPGARSQSQRDDYLNGGDGLGGSDYGPRPGIIPGLRDMLKRFGPLPSTLGGMAPMLPPWAQKILDGGKKWALNLLDGGDRLSGGFGKMTQGLLNTLAGPAASWVANALSTFSGGGVPGGPMPGPKQLSKASPSQAKRYAYGRLKAFGFGNSQWSPLQNLWERESGWDWNADNPTSSAYGIPQALPGSKMASAGANWYTNAGTQVNWGLGYIKDRYGNPANAWAHSENNGWYDTGGIARGRGMLPKNIIAPERVLEPRQTVAFEQMVARNFQPAGSAEIVLPDKLPIVIEDWDRGKGFIDGRAAMQDSSRHRQQRATRAMY